LLKLRERGAVSVHFSELSFNLLPVSYSGHGAPKLLENGCFFRIWDVMMGTVLSEGLPVLDVVPSERDVRIRALPVWFWGCKCFGEVGSEHVF